MKDRTKKKGDSNLGISIDELLAAPLVAAASANSAMAKKQTAFLIESCFDYIENEDEELEFENVIYRPKMISMMLTKNIIKPGLLKSDKPKMEQISTEFQVPILTLLPFNSLCVKDLSVKFDMEIISHRKRKNNLSNQIIDTNNIELHGAISYDTEKKHKNRYRRKNNSKLSVEMNAGSIPLPIGFTTVLELYTKSINSVSLDKKKL